MAKTKTLPGFDENGIYWGPPDKKQTAKYIPADKLALPGPVPIIGEHYQFKHHEDFTIEVLDVYNGDSTNSPDPDPPSDCTNVIVLMRCITKPKQLENATIDEPLVINYYNFKTYFEFVDPVKNTDPELFTPGEFMEIESEESRNSSTNVFD